MLCIGLWRWYINIAITFRRPQRHSAAGRIKPIEKSSNLIGNWPRDLPARRIVPQPTTLPHAPKIMNIVTNNYFLVGFKISPCGQSLDMKLGWHIREETHSTLKSGIQIYFSRIPIGLHGLSKGLLYFFELYSLWVMCNVCVALCVLFCLSVVYYFMWHVCLRVLCLISVPLSPGKTTFAVHADIIRRDLHMPTVKEEICTYSSHYSHRLSAHPNDLSLPLLEPPDLRRLRRFLPNDLPTRLQCTCSNSKLVCKP
jgi:hypothetical protein